MGCICSNKDDDIIEKKYELNKINPEIENKFKSNKRLYNIIIKIMMK